MADAAVTGVTGRIIETDIPAGSIACRGAASIRWS